MGLRIQTAHAFCSRSKAVPTFTKNRIARIISTTGKTTLLTTVLICVWACVQVCSMAPATSPAAKAGMALAATSKVTMAADRRIFVVFFLHKLHYPPIKMGRNVWRQTPSAYRNRFITSAAQNEFLCVEVTFYGALPLANCFSVIVRIFRPKFWQKRISSRMPAET